MNIATFINGMSPTPRSESLEYGDFEFLYVRRGVKIINGKKRCDVITIANIQAKRPGNGAFAKLLIYLFMERRVSVYMECVHNPRFRDYLLRNGFQPIDTDINFFKDCHEVSI